MLKVFAIVAAAELMSLPAARADDAPPTIALLCDGTVTNLSPSTELSFKNYGIVVADGKVSLGDVTVPIIQESGAEIIFYGQAAGTLPPTGRNGPIRASGSVWGHINRITGEVYIQNRDSSGSIDSLETLHCKPANRMF
ncbi:MAG TPA: hypothetical protein VGJ20_46500 [Xanthobacteraceae bacterium]